MLKKEVIWREILFQAIENKQYSFTQKNLAQQFGFSLSTVFNALKIPRATGAIEVKGRYFQVTDKDKLLAIWGTRRKFSQDIIYTTHIDLPVQKIEGQLPADVMPTAYTAYRLKFNEAPADYDKVYAYADNLDAIKKRFPLQKGQPNLIILKMDKYLKRYGALAPLAQIYVDVWNLSDWFAHDYLAALKNRF